jgi:hypothetical protein
VLLAAVLLAGGTFDAGAAGFTVTPAAGAVGTSFTASGTGYASCATWEVAWDGPGLVLGSDDTPGADARSVTAAVPAGAALGTHTVLAICTDASGATSVERATFEVVAPTTTSSSTTTAPTTTTTTTICPVGGPCPTTTSSSTSTTTTTICRVGACPTTSTSSTSTPIPSTTTTRPIPIPSIITIPPIPIPSIITIPPLPTPSIITIPPTPTPSTTTSIPRTTLPTTTTPPPTTAPPPTAALPAAPPPTAALPAAPPPTAPPTAPTAMPAVITGTTTGPVTTVRAPAPTVALPVITATPATVPLATTSVPPTTLPRPTTTLTPRIELDRFAISPGDRVVATATGCDPDATVTVTVEGREVGRTVADASGRFSVALDVQDLAVGRYEVVARCGPTLTTGFDVVLTSKRDPGTSTVAVLLLFFLLAGAAIRRQMA